LFEKTLSLTLIDWNQSFHWISKWPFEISFVMNWQTSNKLRQKLRLVTKRCQSSQRICQPDSISTYLFQKMENHRHPPIG
jgi:hypothetical protein